MSNSPISVSDLLSNHGDQLVTAAKIIGRSKDRQKVFKAVYKGKSKIKTINFLKMETGLSNVRILQEGGKMAPLLMEKVTGGYKKRPEFSTRYKNILGMAKDRKKMNRVPIKVKSIAQSNMSINISFPKSAERAEFVTVDDIKSFYKVRDVSSSIDTTGFAEEKIKKSFQKIVGDTGIFKDWGGEQSDLFTSKFFLKIPGYRLQLLLKVGVLKVS